MTTRYPSNIIISRMTYESPTESNAMNTIINNTVTRLAAFFIGMILCMTPSFAQATLFGVSPDTLTWSANDLTPKEFGVN